MFNMSYYSEKRNSIVFNKGIFCYEKHFIDKNDIKKYLYSDVVFQSGYQWSFFGIDPEPQYRIKDYELSSTDGEFNPFISLNLIERFVYDWADDELNKLSKKMDEKIKLCKHE